MTVERGRVREGEWGWRVSRGVECVLTAVPSRRGATERERRACHTFAVCIVWARLTDVRRSSSITPILIVFAGSPSTCGAGEVRSIRVHGPHSHPNPSIPAVVPCP